MKYYYECGYCDVTVELEHSMADCDIDHKHEECGKIMQRLIFAPSFVGPKSKPTTAEVRERSFKKRQDHHRRMGWKLP